MLGSNVPTVGGLTKGFYYANKWDCECIQIYVTLSRRWDVSYLSGDDISNFISAWRNSSVKQVVAHVPFLVNLASPNSKSRDKSINRLKTEICYADKFGIQHLVLHPGSYTESNKEEGVERVINALNGVIPVIHNTGVIILLETMSGQGTTIGSQFEELKYIINNVDDPNMLGVCFDTSHVFESGYDLRGYGGYHNILNQFDTIVGLNKIRVFHINDSKTPLGSLIDRHAAVGEGYLGLEMFHAIVNDHRFSNIPKILEIPERDEKSHQNIRLLRHLQTLKERPINAIPQEGHLR